MTKITANRVPACYWLRFTIYPTLNWAYVNNLVIRQNRAKTFPERYFCVNKLLNGA